MPHINPCRASVAGVRERMCGDARGPAALAQAAVAAPAAAARPTLRGWARIAAIAASGLALGGAWPVVALAQTDSAIFIPGPGARGSTDAAQMNALLAAPSPAAGVNAAPMPQPVPMAQPAAPNAAEPASGMIVIPGPGERSAGVGGASMPLPPRTYAAARARTVSTTPQRAAMGASAGGVAEVVVEATPETQTGTGAANPALPTARATAYAPAARPVFPAAARANAAPYPGTSAPALPAGEENGEAIRAAALAFLQQQSVGLPGRVNIVVSPVFPRGLAACDSLEPFFPPGARTWGRTTVGVRCVGAKPWTLYVSARVAVDVTYYVAARPIDQGEALSAVDFTAREGDLASLPPAIITDPTRAIGAVALARISAGLPLRTDMLRSESSVVIGQTVRLIAVGSNFTISSEGSVLNNAAPGEQVRVRTAGGQIITGVVKDAGTVQVQI